MFLFVRAARRASLGSVDSGRVGASRRPLRKGSAVSKIFDNIETKFEDGLHAILTNVGVQRADICVGYFNLRGWKLVADDIERLPGGEALEKGTNGVVTSVRRICRLLIGMQRPEQEVVQEMYAIERQPVDAETARRWRKRVANGFRRQLTLGVPTAADEQTLQTLRRLLLGDLDAPFRRRPRRNLTQRRREKRQPEP